MNWLDWLGDVDWQALGTIVAMAGVIVGSVLTLRGQRQEKGIAEATASRAEAAARLTESYTARVVEALEAIAEDDGHTMGGAAEPEHVRWSLTHHDGDRYKLENIGTATAYDTEVTGHETLIGPDRFTGGPTLLPGEALTFLAALSLATADSTITVRWSDSEGGEPEETWRYPLPGRPPRR